ncbi:acetyltransferase (GNAT) family protein [Chitinophaga niastensis]|uniref:Acetyltransferase (GNAT) family protein n=1 Tax=Chitinophaga niastensis TaxID=536980 RepID=A0A2P8HF44_CHINA|nr:GNAT family N-acetyltransferase [Chitinophaga niastensis]PSL44852.1 acetyltransferase (GNAT) family protein [Chitinophaga niastensis]
MINIIRTDANNTDFRSLVMELDKLLAKRNGEDQSFYEQFNKLDNIKHSIVAYVDGVPAGCGAIKAYETDGMEIKRMFVAPAFRGKGIATTILKALELWAAELHVSYCILETGKMLPEAIALYLKNGYDIIRNYGQYVGVTESVCFKKVVASS